MNEPVTVGHVLGFLIGASLIPLALLVWMALVCLPQGIYTLCSLRASDATLKLWLVGNNNSTMGWWKRGRWHAAFHENNRRRGTFAWAGGESLLYRLLVFIFRAPRGGTTSFPAPS